MRERIISRSLPASILLVCVPVVGGSDKPSGFEKMDKKRLPALVFQSPQQVSHLDRRNFKMEDKRTTVQKVSGMTVKTYEKVANAVGLAIG